MKKRRMAAVRPQTGKNKGSVQHVRDVDSKIMFQNPVLCSQFLRDNIDIPMLKNVQPEDIEDETERYQTFLGTEFEADTVKKIRIREGEIEQQIYMISLIEHKSRVDYDVAMQLLRYMLCIWTEYGREMERKEAGVTKRKSFRYPPILPVVYYEGEERWTADLHLKDRILMNEIFDSYLPDFTYKLVRIHDLTNEELMDREDEMSLLMMINKVQTPEELEWLLKTEQPGIARIVRETSEPILEVITSVVWALCMKMNLPREEAKQCVEKVKERRMGYLFENAKLPDIQAVRREAQEAREEAQEAREEAEKAKQEAEQAKREAEQAKKGAEKAKQGAEKAKWKAEQAKQETEQAQQKAIAERQRAAETVQNAYKNTVLVCRSLGASLEQAAEQLMTLYGLAGEEAKEKAEKYWKS